MLANKLLAASGGVDTLYADDVFSAFTYTGNGVWSPPSGGQAIVNGINLTDSGGLVWIKCRSTDSRNVVYDTARGALPFLQTDGAEVPNNASTALTSFDSNGFTLGTNGDGWDRVNTLNRTYVSWTFRKARKFFDIVTYTGNGASNRAISHALGIAPGMLWSKSTSTTGNWNVYHRSATGDLVLNTTAPQTGSRAIMVAASASTFTVSGVANTNGVTYVAHLYAHDDSPESIIKCGSWSTDGTGDATVDLGWEPQFIIYKPTNSSGGNWNIFDVSRGYIINAGAVSKRLYANLSNLEDDSIRDNVQYTEIGKVRLGIGATLFSGIYMAIRRPNKPPTLGTQVYNAIARTGTGAAATVTGVGFAPDLVMLDTRSNTEGGYVFDRLRGAFNALRLASTEATVTDTQYLKTFNMGGVTYGTNSSINASTRTYIDWFFKRAPGVFDEVCYTGLGGGASNFNHSLGSRPEMLVIKSRSDSFDGSFSADWWTAVTKSNGIAEYLMLNNNSASIASFALNAATTSTTFNPFNVTLRSGAGTTGNIAGQNYVAYLFASKAGISKVGSYTGNGSSQTINAGFTTGARFILIKRTDSTGNWYVWDTARGIVAGNDPHLSLNTTAAEVTTDDSIDPHTSGFIVNQLAATNINVSAGTYIYLSFA